MKKKQPLHCAHVAEFYLHMAMTFPATAISIFRDFHASSKVATGFFISARRYAGLALREIKLAGCKADQS